MELATMFGIVGTALILGAYFSRKRSGLHGMLMGGCSVLTVYSVIRHDTIFVVLNLILFVANGVQWMRFRRQE